MTKHNPNSNSFIMKIVKFCIVLSSFIIYSNAADASKDTSKDALLTNYEFVRGPANDYRFGFDSSDGTSRQEQGSSDTAEALAVKGTVSWVAQDGSRYEMSFNADTKGFRPIIKRISGP